MRRTVNHLKQPIHGILLLNKPLDLTSNGALQRAKRLFHAAKAGHTGSLDPLATGMLPLCFGEATKISQYLLDADKCYEATGLLGIKTTTADATGEVLTSQANVQISLSQLLEVLSQYQGKTKQVPSMFSALKHQGRPLYQLARKGLVVDRAARDIQIHQLELTQFDGLSFSFKVVCSKGTYIRNLIEDIGDSLGVGAHLTALHRVYTAGFETQAMYPLAELEAMTSVQREACLLPIDYALQHFKAITLSSVDTAAIRQGKILKDLLMTETCVRLYHEGTLIGFGEMADGGGLKAKRLLAF
jgi:tRNA pseudouridine55 synthase